MSAEIIQFGSDHDEFGLCPICRHSDGFLNIEREHFGVCHRHRVQWNIGSNVFSGWRDECESTWRANSILLAGYRVVQPFYRCRSDDVPPPAAA